jgi:hypothetical protein
MIIDNPHVMRQLIEETKPYFTHPGAEEIYTTKSQEMDAYAKRFGELADQVWQNEYLNSKAEPEVEKTERRSVSQHSGRVQRDSRSAV